MKNIELDNLEHLPKTKQSAQLMVVMTGCYSELNKSIPTTKTSAITVAPIFLEPLIVNYGITSKLLAESVSQFWSKFFVVVCSALGVNKITHTEFHLQTNDQAERFGSTLMSRLCHYVSEEGKD